MQHILTQALVTTVQMFDASFFIWLAARGNNYPAGKTTLGAFKMGINALKTTFASLRVKPCQSVVPWLP